MFGFINLNKPRNLGSRTAINSVVQLVRPHKVGHTGTLDPLASGVLVTAVGPATRLSKYIQDAPKKYRGGFRLGLTSDTEDITGQVEVLENASVVSQGQIEAVLDRFVGCIKQTPPQFSALKVDGVRAYKMARRGVDAKLKEREVEIYSLSVSRFDFPDFELEIECGGGTYVRTLGRDIAKAVDSDAVMTDLVRTAVGPFCIEESVSPIGLTPELLQQYLIPAQRALASFQQVPIGDEVVKQLKNAVAWIPDQPINGPEFLAIDKNQNLIALMRAGDDGSGSYTPRLNFVHYWNPQSS